MAISVERLSAGELRLIMDHAFLPEDAWRIHELVGASDVGASVVLDFREVHDSANAPWGQLAHELCGRGVPRRQRVNM